MAPPKLHDLWQHIFLQLRPDNWSLGSPSVANVFISYKKEDFAIAERIATALRHQGLSVWWDDQLTARESWDATIEKELETASAVVVLWTPRSVGSEWVRTEAHYAAERSKLIPVTVEESSIPIAFLLRQTIPLVGWTGDEQHRQWRKLLTWIADLVATGPTGVGKPQATAAAANRFRDALGHLPSGDPIADGAFVNAATPAGTAFRDGEHLPVMRILPKGAFLLGSSPLTDPDRAAVEGPQRRVEIPEPLAMGVHPVLVAEYRHIVGHVPASAKPAVESRGLRNLFKRTSQDATTPIAFADAAPVTWISFDDAAQFVEKLAKISGERYRIPSESEWEYACRAGTQTPYCFGDTLTPAVALFGATSGPVAAGQYRPNAFGLYDMHGNVREWTTDLWHESYDSTPLDGSPASEGHSSMRVVRGGAWCDDPTLLRSAARMRATQSGRSNLIGVRVARALAR
jgi:formylglycine-generating enzyme required for sulfatase activity